ncbi:3-ketoacyl-CoA thiolase [Desulfocucumis palustris]|uniref:Acetyl-CoA acetyltransferase n=1 Tax=Desulfocucumis palustris TaxID=1898651 RepID=A0A2L2XL48_9FIRM|nr:thiolase family protein [Desulfocucumis palustris]GBF35026.1 3-ketoacyl-CoA thiolase [Desulfocucumis palustris]
MREVYIVEGVRTPIAKSGKRSWFANIRADDLAALVINEVLERAGITGKKREQVDDVILGGTYLMKEMGSNIGRYAAIMAGMPYRTAGCTVDRLCGGGLQSIAFGVSSIAMGWSDLIIAGGVQHMTHLPMLSGVDPNPGLGRFCDPNMVRMGYTAEMVARKFNISREKQDQMAVESHAKAHKATVEGLFRDEILPVTADVPTEDGSAKKMLVDRDQGIRPGATMESLSQLKPVFMEDEIATVTAGNSSQTNDAAAVVLIAGKEKIKELGLKPRLKLAGYAVIGVDPALMGIGPAFAIPRVLKQAAMTKEQIDLWEINEAFASQAVYCTEELGIRNHPLLNPRGSGIALGHPLGCTGARIVTTIMHEMPYYNAKYAVESMCIGHGQGAAAIWEWVG